jgi:hypothetical protein
MQDRLHKHCLQRAGPPGDERLARGALAELAAGGGRRARRTKRADDRFSRKAHAGLDAGIVGRYDVVPILCKAPGRLGQVALLLVVHAGRDSRARAGVCSVHESDSRRRCLLTSASQKIGKRVSAGPSTPASYPGSCQSATPGRSVAAARWATTRRVPSLARRRCEATCGSRRAFTSARVSRALCRGWFVPQGITLKAQPASGRDSA